MGRSSLTYKTGFKDGIPIALGYFFVSMGFGISAVNCGIPVISALLISFTNVTSAGQVAGIKIIASCGVLLSSAVEMLLTQLVINVRYSLMSLSLTQKLDDSFITGRRMLISFFITDEIYAVSAAKKGNVSARYMYGLGTLPLAGWSLGTLAGALAATWMPPELSDIFGIAIYGMFISIVIPPAKKDKGIMLCICISVMLSCLLFFVPVFDFITSGFSIIICALAAASVSAVLRPVRTQDEGGGEL